MHYPILLNLILENNQIHQIQLGNELPLVPELVTLFETPAQRSSNFDEIVSQAFNLIIKANGKALLQSATSPSLFLKTTIDGGIALAPYSLANAAYFEWHVLTKISLSLPQKLRTHLTGCGTLEPILKQLRSVS